MKVQQVVARLKGRSSVVYVCCLYDNGGELLIWLWVYGNAVSDVMSSPVAYLFSRGHREQVAEQINTAILGK